MSPSSDPFSLNVRISQPPKDVNSTDTWTTILKASKAVCSRTIVCSKGTCRCTHQCLPVTALCR